MGILNAAIGPFIGAGLAFLSTRVHDARRQQQENVAAGNLTLSMLNSMLNEYLLWRLGAYADMADPERASDSPLWARIRPNLQSFGDYCIDLKSLSFLFENPERIEALNAVRLAELTYRDMQAVEKFRNDAAQAIYQEVSTRNFTSHAEAEKALGPQRIETMLTAIKSVAKRARDNEKAYTDAISSLRAALEDTLNKWWAKQPHFVKSTVVAPHFRRENLPQLPRPILEMLAEMDRQGAVARTVPQQSAPPEGA
ncbi:MAG TPA: hypothetical protein VHE58_04585 [Burkholderiales bacterium]|nr:hypothetical protein [Burkholderiales bacterium]